MLDKIYTAKPVTIEAKRRLASYRITNNADDTQVLDATFEQQLFDKEGLPADVVSESLTITDLSGISKSIEEIETYLNAAKDVEEAK